MSLPDIVCFVSLLAGTPLAGTTAVSLVETAPVETTLDHPDVPDAWRVWPEMIDGARERLDLAGFYFSNREGSRLEPVLQSILAAGTRLCRKFEKARISTLSPALHKKGRDLLPAHESQGPLSAGSGDFRCRIRHVIRARGEP